MVCRSELRTRSPACGDVIGHYLTRSASKTRYRDWAALHQCYGAAAFITVPLEVSAGVIGTLSAGGGQKMDRHAVEALAARLAEVLLRRTTEALLRVTSFQ